MLDEFLPVGVSPFYYVLKLSSGAQKFLGFCKAGGGLELLVVIFGVVLLRGWGEEFLIVVSVGRGVFEVVLVALVLKLEVGIVDVALAHKFIDR